MDAYRVVIRGWVPGLDGGVGWVANCCSLRGEPLFTEAHEETALVELKHMVGVYAWVGNSRCELAWALCSRPADSDLLNGRLARVAGVHL